MQTQPREASPNGRSAADEQAVSRLEAEIQVKHGLVARPPRDGHRVAERLSPRSCARSRSRHDSLDALSRGIGLPEAARRPARRARVGARGRGADRRPAPHPLGRDGRGGRRRPARCGHRRGRPAARRRRRERAAANSADGKGVAGPGPGRRREGEGSGAAAPRCAYPRGRRPTARQPAGRAAAPGQAGRGGPRRYHRRRQSRAGRHLARRASDRDAAQGQAQRRGGRARADGARSVARCASRSTPPI